MDFAVLSFWILAVMAVASGCGLLTTRHPLHGALYLIGVMAALAGLYALLDSPFLAVLQILVYAGAIMMLVVFVIMVLNRAKDADTRLPDWLSVFACLVPIAFAALVIPTVAQPKVLTVPVAQSTGVVSEQTGTRSGTMSLVARSTTTAVLPGHHVRSPTPALRGEVPAIAHTMFTVRGGQGYWLLFQLIGVLLLIAIVGAVLLAKRRLDAPEAPAAPAKDDHDHH